MITRCYTTWDGSLVLCLENLFSFRSGNCETKYMPWPANVNFHLFSLQSAAVKEVLKDQDGRNGLIAAICAGTICE